MAKKEKIDPKTFVTAWDKAESLNEVAEKLGAKPQSLRSRAVYYRKQGVELKKFPHAGRGGAKLDVESLNSLLTHREKVGAKKASKKRPAKKAAKKR